MQISLVRMLSRLNVDPGSGCGNGYRSGGKFFGGDGEERRGGGDGLVKIKTRQNEGCKE